MDPNGDKEYKNYEKYKKALGDKAIAQKDWHGQDGNWLKSDREGNGDRWNGANEYNLKGARSGEYTSISQRRDFYGWFAKKIDDRGFENNWPGAAYVVASQMANLDDNSTAWLVGKDVVAFGNAGNKAIFDDVLPKLRDLYNGPVMKGEAADNWDAKTLFNEQFIVVQPIYMTQTDETIKVLTKMATGSGMYGFGVPNSLRFQGDIKSPKDRFKHGYTKVVNFWKLQKAYSKSGW